MNYTYLLYLIPFVLMLALWVKDHMQRALYMVIITEVTMASSYLFFGISPRYLFVPYAIVLGGFKYVTDREKRKKIPKTNLVLFGTVVGYYLWILFVQNVIHGYGMFEYQLHRYMSRSFMYVCTAFLIQYFVTDVDRLKKIIKATVIFCAVSAFVGIFQVFMGGVFVDLRNLLQKATAVNVKPTDRAFGLQLFHIPFSYDMLMGTFLSLPIWQKIKNKKGKGIFWFLFAIIIGGLFFSLTRSAIGGAFIGMIVVSLLNREKFFIYTVGGLALAILVVFFINQSYKNSIFKRVTRKEGSGIRETLFTAGFRIIEKNPFGVGNRRYEDYIKENRKMFKDIEGWRRATRVGVHNHIMLNTVYFGWIAGFLSILFIIELFYICRRVYKGSSYYFIRNITLLITGFLVAYCINISMHNAGFFKGDATIWIVTGVLLSLNRIVEQKSEAGS